jgi:hypothetical protein
MVGASLKPTGPASATWAGKVTAAFGFSFDLPSTCTIAGTVYMSNPAFALSFVGSSANPVTPTVMFPSGGQVLLTLGALFSGAVQCNSACNVSATSGSIINSTAVFTGPVTISLDQSTMLSGVTVPSVAIVCEFCRLTCLLVPAPRIFESNRSLLYCWWHDVAAVSNSTIGSFGPYSELQLSAGAFVTFLSNTASHYINKIVGVAPCGLIAPSIRSFLLVAASMEMAYPTNVPDAGLVLNGVSVAVQNSFCTFVPICIFLLFSLFSFVFVLCLTASTVCVAMSICSSSSRVLFYRNATLTVSGESPIARFGTCGAGATVEYKRADSFVGSFLRHAGNLTFSTVLNPVPAVSTSVCFDNVQNVVLPAYVSQAPPMPCDLPYDGCGYGLCNIAGTASCTNFFQPNSFQVCTALYFGANQSCYLTPRSPLLMQCTCRAGFTGTLCTTNINECGMLFTAFD